MAAIVKGESPKPVCTSTTDDIVVPGCTIIENFITTEEEEFLLQSDMASEESPKWLESSIGRRQQHYGFKFNYYTRMIDFLNTVDDIPHHCASVVAKLEEFVGVGSCESTDCPHFNQVTVNEYLPGHGIGSHIDTVNCIGPVLCSLSLGSGCVMALTNQDNAQVEGAPQNGNEESARGSGGRKLVYLPRRSMLVLRGDARYHYTHGIAYRKSDMHQGQVIPRTRRVSLTFRQVVLPGDIPASALGATAVEKSNVFDVYDSIAIHWHHTRGKRKVFWAVVREFLEALPAGSLVADVGCGDGKYFGVTNENDLVMVGCDRSVGLLKALKDSERATNAALLGGLVDGEGSGKPTHNQTFCCDAVQVPMRSDCFDATLCIAVLHHLGSVDRRIAVIRELVRVTRPGGCVLIQAWAFEQEAGSRHQFKPPSPPTEEPEGGTETGGKIDAAKAAKKPTAAGGSATDQDVLVAWRLTKCWAQPGETETAEAEDVGSEPTVDAAPGDTRMDSSTPEDKAKLYAALNAAKARKRDKKLSKKARAAAVQEKEARERAEKTCPVRRVADAPAGGEVEESERHVVYQRYCHVYREGELEDLCSSVPGVRIVQRGYDRSNWFVVLQKFDMASDGRLGLSQGRSSAVPSPLDRVRTTTA